MGGFRHRPLYIEMENRFSATGTLFGQPPPASIVHARRAIARRALADKIDVVILCRVRNWRGAGIAIAVTDSSDPVQETRMRDVILAAAGEAADATLLPAREISGQSETHEDFSAQLAQARSAGEAEGHKQGSANERARIRSIITSEQAKGREELAHYFAFDTDLAAETVLLALSKSPAAKSNLDGAMAREAQPKLGTGGERAAAEPPRMISTEEVYARRRAAVAAVLQR